MKIYQPDIVLIHIGTNDLAQGTSAPVMTQNLIKLVGDVYAGKPDTYVVLSSIIPSPVGNQETWTNFNASIPGIAAIYRGQGKKIVALDMSHALTPDDFVDGMHPNANGNAKMAWIWYPTVATIYREYMR
jgi:lysophospholipase L1-like esterase